MDTDALQDLVNEARNGQGGPQPDAGDVEWPDGATWCIDWFGARFFSTQALAVHVCAVAEAMNETSGWAALEPATSPRHLAAWVAAIIASASEELDVNDAWSLVMATPAVDLVGCLTIREE